MAIPKKLKGRIALIALKEAEDNLGEEEMDEESEDLEDVCTCPKCGYKGPEVTFKD